MIALRPATADDFRRYAGAGLPEEWCAGGWVCGDVLEEGGQIVAYGLVTQDRYGRIWGWFSRKGPVSRFLMHRKALAMIDLLRRCGEPALYAVCSEAIPGAAMWLQRLGFAPARELTTDPNHSVWKCDLTST